MTKSQDRIFWLLIALAVALRLYGINSPLTDGGQERQTQVAMIARNLLRDNFNVLLPRIDIFPPGPGYMLMEFPLQSLLMAFAYVLFGVQDWIGRSISLVFDIGSIYFFFQFSKSFFERRSALCATAIYSLTPMSIFFGRAVFPEPVFLFFSMGSLFFAQRFRESSSGYYMSICFAAIACLIKPPPGIVMLLPLSLILNENKARPIINRSQIRYCLLALVPITAWALWGRHVGQGLAPGWSPYQLSALQRWGVPYGWFDPKFYTFVATSIVAVTLTPLVAVLAVFGLYKINQHSRARILLAWFIALVVYSFGTPGAQASHWNYQVPFIPLGAILCVHGFACAYRTGLGQRLFASVSERSSAFYIIMFFAILFHLPIYWSVARDAYDIRKRLPYGLEVGEIVKGNVRQDGFVLLVEPAIVPVPQTYHMDRKALQFPLAGTEKMLIEDIQKQEQLGANAVVAVDTPYGSGVELLNKNPDALNYIKANYRLVAQHEHYMIFVR